MNINTIRNRKDDIVKMTKETLDFFALLSVLNYSIYRFLQSAMFDFVYTNTYKYLTIGLLILFGGLRFVHVFYQSNWKDNDKKERTRELIKLLVVACLSLPFVYVGWKHDYKILIFLPIVAMCLYEMEADKVLRSFALTISILLAATIICSLTGTVRNLTVYRRAGYIAGSYGIINTSDFASYFTFLGLCIWCIQKWKNISASIWFCVSFAAITALVYWLTDSNTLLICNIMTEIAVIWDCIEEKKRGRGNSRVNKIAVVVFPVICVVFFILVFLYGKGNSIAVKADSLLTYRLSDSYALIKKYGIHLFGQTIPTMHGNGGTVVRNWSSGYGYLDVTYAMLAVRYGVVLLVIVMSVWVLSTQRALREGNRRIALAMSIIAFHALSEARFMDVNYNIFLVMPLCVFSKKNGEERIGESYSKTYQWIRYGFTVICCIMLYLILPKTFSWLRTIFSLKGWNKGVHEFWALLISVGLIGLFILFWKAGIKFLQKKYKVASILLGVIVAFTTVSVITGNSLIESGLMEKKEAIETDGELIRFVQSVATQPVYAAEKSELYQRHYGGFSDHIFSSEELYRWPRGTIFTDASVEVLGIVNRGGRYMQISPTSGMYTYDEKVVDAVAAAGYIWKRYYNSERTCDLSDLSFRNGLVISNDNLILNGTTQSISSNLEWDQFAGSYEVSYSIELPDRASFTDEDVICTLQVKGEAGDRVILERKVCGSDFDQSGKITISITYEIEDTPKVSYLIFAEDGVTIYVDEIAWRRVS